MIMMKLFNDKQFYKSLFAIALPIMLQSLISSMVNMLDTIMVGQLGTVEIASVALGNQIFFLFNLLIYGICTGGAVFSTQFWGKKDILGIRKNQGLSLFLCLGTGIIFTIGVALFPDKIIGIYSRDLTVIKTGAVYLRNLVPVFIPFSISMVFIFTLRAVEKVKLALISTFISLTINLILNYLFIFGAGPVPAMGVAGAALATVISRVVEMIILLSVTYIKKYPAAGNLKEFSGFDNSYVKRFFKIAFPVILNEVIWSFGITFQNFIFARTGTDAIAAFNIINTFSQLTWVVFIGLASGINVLIGKKIGEGNEDTARHYGSRVLRLAPMMAFGTIIILVLFFRTMPYIFNVNENVITIAGQLFIVLCCAYPFRSFNISLNDGICRAGGDTLFCTLYDLIGMWGFSLPLGAIACFIFKTPVWIIYSLILLEQPIKIIVGTWRFKSGKWLHNVIEEVKLC